jgi:translation initiation factor IF-3
VSDRNFRVNRQIRVPQVRLIDQNGEQVGVVATDEARRRADDAGMDLVEVSPTAQPPVCRILDYGKFRYEQKKKERASHKIHGHHGGQLKELRVRPAMHSHDLGYRIEQGRRFLEDGHKIQVVCVFRGRQMEHPELGHRIMNAVVEALGDLCKVESPPKLLGKRMSMLLAHK